MTNVPTVLNRRFSPARKLLAATAAVLAVAVGSVASITPLNPPAHDVSGRIDGLVVDDPTGVVYVSIERNPVKLFGIQRLLMAGSFEEAWRRKEAEEQARGRLDGKLASCDHSNGSGKFICWADGVNIGQKLVELGIAEPS